MALITTPRQLAKRAELYHQLSAMLSAGVTLVRALEMSGRDPRGRVSRRTINTLLEHLRSGQTFTESLRLVQGDVPEFDKALLAVGEKSGRLDDTFRLLANYYTTRAKIIRDTISGMIITVVTLHVFLLVFPLSFLIAAAQGIMENDPSRWWPFIIEKIVCYGALYAIVFGVIFACQGGRGEGWRSLIERIAQCVPVLRTAQRYLALSRAAAALEALINAGVSIITGWEMAAVASGSPELKRIVASWQPQLQAGHTPGQLVSAYSYFPVTFADLYATAEVSGKLDEGLRRLQVYYLDEGFRAMRLFTGILNGVIYASVVLVVGYSIIRFWLNYYGQMMNAF